MKINKLDSTSSFNGYNSILKSMYKDGRLPSVQIGLYGGYLTPKTVSLEHIRPKSNGGSTALRNMTLATRENNRIRGNQDINQFLTHTMLYNYLIQFKNLIVKYKGKIFDGNKYILDVISTLRKIGFKDINSH